MDNICRICEKTIDSPAHFYKNHKIKEKDYYERFYENKDKLTGELIDFKSVDSYFLTDFASKTNLRKYLETSPKDIGIKYLTEWLLRRKEYKNLIYAPGEFECRSLLFPSIKFINQFYGKDSYKDICNNAGLKLRYDYNLSIDLSNNPEEIWCDSREQKPYCKLELPIKIQTLNFADYCPNPNPDNLFIERKELSDWAGVMSKGYERFKRELKRA